MKKYQVTGTLTHNLSVEVEADSEEHALEIATSINEDEWDDCGVELTADYAEEIKND